MSVHVVLNINLSMLIRVEAEECYSKPTRLRKPRNEQRTREEKTGHGAIRSLGTGQKTDESRQPIAVSDISIYICLI